MKTKTTNLSLLKFTVLICFALVTPAAFGQTTIIWTNLLMTAPGGYDIGYSTNWSGPAGPGLNRPVSLTTLEWNGTVPGSIHVYNDIGNIDNNGGLGAPGGAFGSSGLSFYVNTNQTSPVQISTHDSPSSGVMGFNTLKVDFGAGQLTLGDNSQNAWMLTGRPSGATHDFINNSTNPVIITPSVAWQRGGGSDFTMEFDSSIATPGSGIGDYGITNNLSALAGGGIFLWFVSSGTITWTGYSIPYATSGSAINSPIYINAGTTLILKTNSCFSTTPGNETQAIQNNNPGPAGTPASALIYDGNSPQTFGGVISGAISLTVKSGTVTLTNNNTYTGGTSISNSATLNIGSGGASGSVGTGNVTNNSLLIFNRSDLGLTVGETITGSGSVVQSGSGGVTLNGALKTTGPTTVSNGVMVIAGGSVGGDLNVSGGTLVPSAVGAIGTLNVASNLNINSGAVTIMVNKSLSPSNSVVIVTNGGTITAQPGTVLKLPNYGPAFMAGDMFKVFSGPVSGGAGMTIQAPGVTSFVNNLAFDGSVTVQTVVDPSTEQIIASPSGGNMHLTWPAAWLGVHLQSQTNTLATGLGTNWVTIQGSDTATSYDVPLRNTNVFYRLAP